MDCCSDYYVYFCIVLLFPLTAISFSWMLFSILKHYLELYITDAALKVSRSLYCFITSISHGAENYFPRLWGTSISDAILICYASLV